MLLSIHKRSKTCGRYTSFFFFFYWHYNPPCVLAFSVILFHSAISLHWFLHCLIPIIFISSSISAIHLFLGLPLIFIPIGFHSDILLGVLLSSIRITWPSQAILLLFINLTVSAFGRYKYESSTMRQKFHNKCANMSCPSTLELQLWEGHGLVTAGVRSCYLNSCEICRLRLGVMSNEVEAIQNEGMIKVWKTTTINGGNQWSAR